MRVLACAAVAAVIAVFGGRTARAQGGRALTVDDVLRLEELGSVVPSPDGKYVAIAVRRALGRVARVRMPTPDERSDIWVVRLKDGRRTQVTHGGADGSAWWDPTWSPDSKRLAMLSTDGCRCGRAWTWRLGDGAPALVSARNVDLWVFTGTEVYDGTIQPLVWLDRETLLVPLLPAGERAHIDLSGEADSATAARRSAARRGDVSTASVLESVPGQVEPYLEQETIVAANVAWHSTRGIATIPRDPTTSGERSLLLSPDHRVLAVLTSHIDAVPPTQRLPRMTNGYSLGFVHPMVRDTLRWVGEFAGSDSLGDELPVPAWTPNGDTVIVRGRWRTAAGSQAGVWAIDVRTRTVRAASGCPASVPRCSAAWLAAAGARPSVIGDTGLYRFDRRDGRLVDVLPSTLRQPTLHLVHLGAGADTSCVVATVRDANGGSAAYRVDASSDVGAADYVGPLASGYRVNQCVPHSHGLIVSRRDRAVAYLASGRLTMVFAVNAWTDSIVDPRKVAVRYRSADGESLGAVVVLPPARAGAPDGPYPLVVWVYAEATYDDTAQVRDDRTWSSPFNLALLTAQGYAVLYPSIPLWPADSAGGDVVSHLTGDVLPAVDRMASLGMIDTSRVAVMGQSFGGYTTLALITRTRRFRSAIALAVASDQVSYSGTFRFWDRPWSYAH
ncbi:MAG: prolyl oligopeptidase family serine peptidase, partial [Gemmatimonadaceae bacterium]